MAIISMLLGGVVGSVAALAGWLVFGLSLSAALMLYAALSFGLPVAVIALGAIRPNQSQDDAQAYRMQG